MSVNNFVETIQRIALSAVEASKPVSVMTGVIKSVEPLEIQINSKLFYPEEAIIIPQHLKSVTGTTVEEYPVKVNMDIGLKAGDKVSVLRVQGGQKCVLLGVI